MSTNTNNDSSNKIWGRNSAVSLKEIQEELNFPKSVDGWNKWTMNHTHHALKKMKANGFEDHPSNCGYFHPTIRETKFNIPIHPIDSDKKESQADYQSRLWSYFNYDVSSSASHEEQSPHDHRRKSEEKLDRLLQRRSVDLLTFLTDMNAESLAEMDGGVFSVIDAKIEEAKEKVEETKRIQTRRKAEGIQEEETDVAEDDDNEDDSNFLII